MKRLLFVVALLCPYLSYAQDYTYEDLSQDTLQTMEEVFENVDLALVPSGLLLERSFPLANPTLHDGLHLDAHSPATKLAFRRLSGLQRRAED